MISTNLSLVMLVGYKRKGSFAVLEGGAD